MEYYTTTSEHSTNTSTACDTPNIKVDTPECNRYTLSLCVNFQGFLFWVTCDTPSIKIDTTEQQVALDITSRIYIHTTNRQHTLISTTSGENFNTIYNTNQKIQITRYILAQLQLLSKYYKTCIIRLLQLLCKMITPSI